MFFFRVVVEAFEVDDCFDDVAFNAVFLERDEGFTFANLDIVFWLFGFFVKYDYLCRTRIFVGKFKL